MSHFKCARQRLGLVSFFKRVPAAVKSGALFAALLMLNLMTDNSLSAAELIKPPFEASLKSRYVLVIAHAPGDGSDRLTIQQRLWDPGQQLLDIADIKVSNLDLSQPADQSAPMCVILLLSKYTRHPLYRDEMLDDPNGYSVQTMPLVGDGVFACSDEFVTVMDHVLNQQGQTDADQVSVAAGTPAPLTALISLLDSDDPPSQRIAAFELAMHPDWMASADSTQAQSLKAQLRRTDWSDEMLEMLVVAAADMPPRQLQSWFRQRLMHMLSERRAPFDLASHTPQLLRTILDALRTQADLSTAERDIVQALLFANAPGVAKAAIALLASQNGDALAAQLQQSLAEPGQRERMHPETLRHARVWLRAHAEVASADG